RRQRRDGIESTQKMWRGEMDRRDEAGGEEKSAEERRNRKSAEVSRSPDRE
ncbi:unnamed protein product, partial [Arabidopsis halleri]